MLPLQLRTYIVPPNELKNYMPSNLHVPLLITDNDKVSYITLAELCEFSKLKVLL